MSSQTGSLAYKTPLERAQPRYGMNDLPTEMKMRIVELCDEQDEQFKEWVKQAERSSVPYALESYDPRVGRSVGSLFQVSKEFSALAAPYLFKVIRATRMNGDFKSLIAASHLSYLSSFTELYLDHPRKETFAGILESFSALRNIKKLRIKSDRSGALILENICVLVPAKEIIAMYGASGLPPLVQVEAHGVQPSLLATVLEYAHTSLRALKTAFEASDLDTATSFSRAFSSLSSLQELSLYIGDDNMDDSSDISPFLQHLPHAPLPPLRSLTIRCEHLHQSHVEFASLFSATLKSLDFASLAAEGDVRGTVQPRFETEVFPSLIHLALRGEHNLHIETLSSITSRSFPSLTGTLTLDLECVNSWEDPLAVLQRLPSISTLSVPTFPLLNQAEQSTIRTVCEGRGVGLRWSPGP